MMRKKDFVEKDTMFGPMPNFDNLFEKFFIDKSAQLLFKSMPTDKSICLNEELIHIGNRLNALPDTVDLNWMHQIELADNYQQQNLEIIYNNNQVYYKTIKTIFKNEKLAAFPSKDLEISLGLQFVPYNKDAVYQCNKCRQKFEFNYHLMLHVRYFCVKKCSLKRKASHQVDQDNQMNSNKLTMDFINYIQLFNNPQMNMSEQLLRQVIQQFNEGLTSKATTQDDEEEVVVTRPQSADLGLMINTQGAQNWCAKCNQHFRLTSDLVYHMRTFHKKDKSPAHAEAQSSRGKRVCTPLSKLGILNSSDETGRELKCLKCEICNETFKEKHHLSRHMTSHRD